MTNISTKDTGKLTERKIIAWDGDLKCPEDRETLQYTGCVIITQGGKEFHYSVYYCPKCHRHFESDHAWPTVIC